MGGCATSTGSDGRKEASRAVWTAEHAAPAVGRRADVQGSVLCLRPVGRSGPSSEPHGQHVLTSLPVYLPGCSARPLDADPSQDPPHPRIQATGKQARVAFVPGPVEPGRPPLWAGPQVRTEQEESSKKGEINAGRTLGTIWGNRGWREKGTCLRSHGKPQTAGTDPESPAEPRHGRLTRPRVLRGPGT